MSMKQKMYRVKERLANKFSLFLRVPASRFALLHKLGLVYTFSASIFK